MSDCNKLFSDFNKEITPSADQMSKMKSSREALEKKIVSKLQQELKQTPTFYTQGSSAKDMRTIIIKENGTYDADRGIYLPSKPSVSGETIQKYVYDAVKDHTKDGAEHRKKCIRVLYQSEYNIDFPVYYEVKGEDYSYMAVKGNDWIKDDPWHMIQWFSDKKDKDGQLLRVIKYLKAWSSKSSFKMPSGIALAVWAAQGFVESAGRDDISLLETLKTIKSSLGTIVTCYAPVEPKDDLTSKLSVTQKENFKTALGNFIDDGQKAVDETNQLAASKLWRVHLGARFPYGKDEDVDSKSRTLMASAGLILDGVAKLNRDGLINTTTGIDHKPHRNYGG